MDDWPSSPVDDDALCFTNPSFVYILVHNAVTNCYYFMQLSGLFLKVPIKRDQMTLDIIQSKKVQIITETQD